MREKKPFGVGERVAAYAGGTRRVGVVLAIQEGGNLCVRESSGDQWVYSPQQCRRLRPKAKARELWITKTALEMLERDSVDAQRAILAGHVSLRNVAGHEDVCFREVRRK